MKDPEDEAWDELEAAIKMRDATAWRKRQIEEIRRVRSVDDAFEDWLQSAKAAAVRFANRRVMRSYRPMRNGSLPQARLRPGRRRFEIPQTVGGARVLKRT